MNVEEINAVKQALAQAGFAGLTVHVGAGVATLNGSLPFDAETLELLQSAWMGHEGSVATEV